MRGLNSHLRAGAQRKTHGAKVPRLLAKYIGAFLAKVGLSFDAGLPWLAIGSTQSLISAMVNPVLNAPPLESGDHLTRAEFERRYAASLGIKAELIEGVVYVASPVRAQHHARPHAVIMAWLGGYWAATPGVDLQDNATVRLDFENELQPDALLRLEPEHGGRSSISADDYVEGSPELIVEVAASSAANDMNDKLQVYQRNGVREYIVWQVYENRVDWFVLMGGRYLPLLPDEQNVIRSREFPGLWLAVDALREGDRPLLMATLNQGLNTQEHQTFVARLTASR
jgi:Uma2 family endonuclease